jgi:hypothetical protein
MFSTSTIRNRFDALHQNAGKKRFSVESPMISLGSVQ